MTKLTQQEIEQERVKFEECFFSIYQEKISQEWMGECFCYMSDGIQERFKFWLARAELEKELKEKLTDEFINALPSKFITESKNG